MSGTTDLVIRGATVITPEVAVAGGVVAVAGGRIVYVGPEAEAPGAAAPADAGGGFLVPGFVDLHCHGGGGFDVVAGRYDPATRNFSGSDEELRSAVRGVAAAHAAHGTTAMVLATWAAPEPELLRALTAIGEAAGAGDAAARVVGANLEGSYLVGAAWAGAQNPEYFRRPSVEDFDRLNAAARGAIRVCNVAPEGGYPAIDLVRHLIRCGTVAASGHTGASCAETKACIDAGVTLAVHFSNGPSATSFKPPGMAMEAMLGDPRVTLELIADGYHVNPHYLLSFLAAKRFRAVLVTDAQAPTEAAGIGRLALAGKVGELSADGRVLRLQGSATTLFGSVLTMDRAVANVVEWLSEGLPGMYQNAPVIDPPPSKEEALILVSRLASGFPAEVLGLRRELGAIEPGLAADLVLLDEGLAVKRVWRGGREVRGQ
jgi:N-acetylglucosamine-6-phosphate deacetylase